MIDAEPIKTIQIDESIVAWECWSAGGTKLGEQWRWTQEKRYRWFGEEGIRHLPVCYAVGEDYRMAFEDRRLILCEGPFDRVALKRVFPDWAVMARLTAAIGKELTRSLLRTVETVVLATDMNKAGDKGVEKAQKRLGDVAEVRLTYPADDPGDLLEKYGIDKCRRLLQPQIAHLSWL